MNSRTTTFPLLFATASVALSLALSGCTAVSPDKIHVSPTSTPTHSSGVEGAATGTPDACTLVPPAILKTTLGFDPGKGTASKGYFPGDTKCTFDGVGLIDVEVTSQVDTYMSAETYTTSQVDGAVDVDAASGADRGFVSKSEVFVAKGSIGVFVTSGQDVSIPAAQMLATALTAAIPKA